MVSDASLQRPPTAATSSRARNINRSMIKTMFSELVKNPEVDLMSLIPNSYKTKMRDCNLKPRNVKKYSSKLAKLNREKFTKILSQFQQDPFSSLADHLDPVRYQRSRRKCSPESSASMPLLTSKYSEPLSQDFYAFLEATTGPKFEVVEPLSPDAEELLRSNSCVDVDITSKEELKCALRRLKWYRRNDAGYRFTAKLSDNMHAIFTTKNQHNHCATLQYLAEHAPEVPVKKLHGFVRFEGWDLMFRSYPPSSLLSKVWPTLDLYHKISIQGQLENIFFKLRQIPWDGRAPGCLDGSGITIRRGFQDEVKNEEPIYSLVEFEDFIFSSRPWVTEHHALFLKSLLPVGRLEEEPVFTHGNLRPDDIVVHKTEDGEWRVTGITGWQDAGFYPPYWEAAKATSTFLCNSEDDWYLMLPGSITSPRFSSALLVDRVLEDTNQYAGTYEKHPKIADIDDRVEVNGVEILVSNTERTSLQQSELS